MMMFELPDVKKRDTSWRRYIRFLDLRFSRYQEEKHFQSYYYFIFIKQIRIAIAFLTSVLFIALMVDYLKPLDIDSLYPLLPYDYINQTIVSGDPTPSKPPRSDQLVEHESIYSFIIRILMVGLLGVYFLFTFTHQFKKLWKLYSTIMSFIATCITIIFITDFRTIPERMILLYIAITIASGMTFLPATTSTLCLSVFYFIYYFLENDIYFKSMLLVSSFIFTALIFLWLISQNREKLIREKFRTLEKLKLQTIRSSKIINQMLPTVVLQRLRLQSSKESEKQQQQLQQQQQKQEEEELKKEEAEETIVDITIKDDANSSSQPSTTNNGQDTIITITPSVPRKSQTVDPQSPSSLQPGSYVGSNNNNNNNGKNGEILDNNGDQLIVDNYENVTILFCEIVNFTALVEKVPASSVIPLLNEIYNSFDRLTDVYGVTKVEHISNVYMVVGGCPDECSDHAQRIAHMSLGMLSIVQKFDIVQVRMGIHTGNVVGGIIGKKKLSWHLFGDTINTASRMASHGSIGRIQLSQPVQQLLRAKFLLEERGKIQVKGKGPMRTWYLVKTKSLDKRYTSIFSSLPLEKQYVPPIDISEVQYINDNSTENLPPPASATTTTTTTTTTIPNLHLNLSPNVSMDHNVVPTPRQRKNSIFQSVVPPKVLNFLSTNNNNNSLNNNNNSIDSIGKTSGTQYLTTLTSGLDSIGKSNKVNTSTGSLRVKQVTILQGEGGRGRAYSIGGAGGDTDSIGGNPEDQDIDMDQMDSVGKGIRGSNIIQSNHNNLLNIENDLKKHYTLDYLTLSFKSRDGIVEQEFRKDYNLKILKKVLMSMLFANAMFGFGAITDYFYLKYIYPEEYDHITGARVAMIMSGLIYIYIVQKATRLHRHCQILGAIYFIVVAIALLVLVSVPPLNVDYPLDGILVSALMIITTVCYNFSGIRFMLSNIVCLCCVFFFQLSLAWKETPRDVMLSNNFYLITGILLNITTSYMDELFLRQNWVHGKLLEKDRKETEQLVSEILPPNVVSQMKSGRQLINDEFEQVTIFLSDIVGFTELAAKLTPYQLVETLNQIYSAFDEIAARHQVTKIATIGDAYLCVCGCPDKMEDHAQRVVAMALEMLEAIKSIKTIDNIPIKMRIGIHTGPVIAGVVGIKMIHYQLWGESVYITQQMESTSIANSIHLSETTARLLQHLYIFEERGDNIIKRKKIKTYFLVRKRVESDPPPIEIIPTFIPKPTFSNTISVVKGNIGASMPIFTTTNDQQPKQQDQQQQQQIIEDDESTNDILTDSNTMTDYNHLSSDSLVYRQSTPPRPLSSKSSPPQSSTSNEEEPPILINNNILSPIQKVQPKDDFEDDDYDDIIEEGDINLPNK